MMVPASSQIHRWAVGHTLRPDWSDLQKSDGKKADVCDPRSVGLLRAQTQGFCHS